MSPVAGSPFDSAWSASARTHGDGEPLSDQFLDDLPTFGDDGPWTALRVDPVGVLIDAKVMIHGRQQRREAFLDAAPFHFVAVVIEITPRAADGDKGGARFDQTTCEQGFLAEAVPAIPVAHRGRFFIETESALRPAGHEHFAG